MGKLAQAVQDFCANWTGLESSIKFSMSTLLTQYLLNRPLIVQVDNIYVYFLQPYFIYKITLKKKIK